MSRVTVTQAEKDPSKIAFATRQLSEACVPFTGDSGSGGVAGFVPAPEAGDATNYLKGDGTWADPTPASASDTVAGLVELATSAETLTGTDTTRAVTPKGAADTYVSLAGGDNLTGGFTTTSYSGGTLTGSNQTFTPAPLNGAFQHLTLNGSSLTGTWTFAVPSSACASLIVEVTNGGSGAVAATISTSGYAKVVGSWASTNGYKYQFIAIRSNSGSTLTIQPMQ